MPLDSKKKKKKIRPLDGDCKDYKTSKWIQFSEDSLPDHTNIYRKQLYLLKSLTW